VAISPKGGLTGSDREEQVLRKLILAAMGTSLLLGVFAVPASAVSPPEVLEVNAIPDTRIEICSGGVEHLNLKYGRAVDWDPDGGVVTRWTIRKFAPGTCKGKKLGRFAYSFENGRNYTVAYWKPARGIRMSVFKNDKTISVGNATMTIRHVAQAKASDFWIWQKLPTIAGIPDEGPTITALGRGKSSPHFIAQSWDTMVAAFPVKSQRRWNSAFGNKRLQPDTAYQAIFMGNKQSNMKIKIWAID
jgi:hypothetical protein